MSPKEKHASRQFVDLIWQSSSTYPVWEPACDGIRAGDFGKLDRKTGDFEWKGSIYDIEDLKEQLVNHKPFKEPGGDGAINIASTNARYVTASPSITVDVQVAKTALQGQWKFNNGAGALLAIRKPQLEKLPKRLDIEPLTNHKALRNMFLVTSVTACSAYALYHASCDESSVSLRLSGQAPVGSSASTGPGVSAAWESECTGGVCRTQSAKKGTFTVLFSLKQCKKKESWLKRLFRDSPGPELEGLDILEDAYPPWGLLDERGAEIKRKKF